VIIYCQQCNTTPLRSDRGDINAADFLERFDSAQMLRPLCPPCLGQKPRSLAPGQ